MKIVITLVWSLMLVTLLNYVVGAIANIPFNFETGAILSVVFSIFILIMGKVIPDGTVADH